MVSKASSRPRASAGRQLKAALALLLVVGVLVGGGWGIYYLTVGRPLLEGEHNHHFGLIELAGENVVLRHTFSLRNETGRPVEVREVKTSCRCTVIDLDTPHTLAPGESLDVSASLNVASDGHKLERIFLVCGDDGVEILRVIAEARNVKRLVVPVKGIVLEPGKPVDRTVLYFDYDSNDPPSAPAIESPEGVRASFDTWIIQKRRAPGDGLPARWSGRLYVEQTAQELPEGAALVLRVGDDQEVTVPLAPSSAPHLAFPQTPP